MSNTNGQIPAGWYPDPSGSPRSRWWDGMSWTEHYQPVAYGQSVVDAQPAYGQPEYGYPAYATAPERPLLPAGTPIYTVFIWLVTLLPLATLLILPFWNPVAAISEMRTSQNFYTFGTLLAQLLSFIGYGLTVVFAWLDYRRLERVGVVRPFHWAWVFVSGIVYVIGRSIIVRRVAPGRGLAPIWVSGGVVVVSLVIMLVWVSFLFSGIMQMAPTPASFSGGSGA